MNVRTMFYNVEWDFDQEVRYIAKIWFVIMLVFIPVWYFENSSQPILLQMQSAATRRTRGCF